MTEHDFSAPGQPQPPSPPPYADPAAAAPPYAPAAPYQGLNDDQRSIMETKGKRAIGFGVAWLLGGLVLTVVTLGMASDADGGMYIVAWGPMLYGLWRLGSGLFTLGRARR